ncbi:translation initiation factor IF-2-like isoform X7 [Accipiter gentilis]|uniref:translation initiation factor IF-2-like isoform X4 n=1 Tax=Astur gentilis TaxID=8957 RepID=UPI00210F9626|nr:translation initiation factor IF-2-like isoform X4 [Accipiter gentilis]XP_049652642.1 translation initiation factor IF-2-like isoform X6 [Accipiter gentilis]XP_049652643.1 translation initiation factor IF-2-like isoform X7 [Accipiter gentilis]
MATQHGPELKTWGRIRAIFRKVREEGLTWKEAKRLMHAQAERGVQADGGARTEGLTEVAEQTPLVLPVQPSAPAEPPGYPWEEFERERERAREEEREKDRQLIQEAEEPVAEQRRREKERQRLEEAERAVMKGSEKEQAEEGAVPLYDPEDWVPGRVLRTAPQAHPKMAPTSAFSPDVSPEVGRGGARPKEGGKKVRTPPLTRVAEEEESGPDSIEGSAQRLEEAWQLVGGHRCRPPHAAVKQKAISDCKAQSAAASETATPIETATPMSLIPVSGPAADPLQMLQRVVEEIQEQVKQQRQLLQAAGEQKGVPDSPKITLPDWKIVAKECVMDGIRFEGPPLVCPVRAGPGGVGVEWSLLDSKLLQQVKKTVDEYGLGHPMTGSLLDVGFFSGSLTPWDSRQFCSMILTPIFFLI